jgi:hypothetical protein
MAGRRSPTSRINSATGTPRRRLHQHRHNLLHRRFSFIVESSALARVQFD